MRSSLWVAAVLLALAGAAHTQSPFGNPGIVPTTAVTHQAIQTFTSAATSIGMNPPPVGGSGGTTTVSGIATYQYNTADLSDFNWAGVATGSGTTGAIAFDVKWWTAGAVGPPPQFSIVVGYVSTAYHEAAHIVYQTWVHDWAAANPMAWLAYSLCISQLTNPDGTSKGYTGNSGDKAPCDEAYAYSVSSVNLCHDKQDICDNDKLTPEEKAPLLEEIDKRIEFNNKQCEGHNADCTSCNGPMPDGWGGCPGPCVCN